MRAAEILQTLIARGNREMGQGGQALTRQAGLIGGKLEDLYLSPLSGEFNGIAIMQVPSDAAMEEINLVIRSSGSFARFQAVSALTPPSSRRCRKRPSRELRATFHRAGDPPAFPDHVCRQ